MGAFSDYDDYDAVGLADLIERAEVTSFELVEAAIERVEARNPALNAVIVKQYERARQQAAAGDVAGRFRGVPFLTKDLAWVEGDVTSFGSVFFRNYVPEVTDEIQKRMQRAGLISIGRTNSPEFGLLPTTEPALHGPTKNPWDRTRSSGGSSGGAAAAVAAGMVPMAHGGDGGGSIRIPAAACGVFGLKPSRGRMPRYPVSPSDYLSVELGLSRTVRDTAALLDATHGSMPGAAYHAPPPDQPFSAAVNVEPEPLTIAVATTDFRGKVTSPECVVAVERTAAKLEELGHRVEYATPTVDGDALAEAFFTVWESLAESIFAVILSEAEKRKGGAVLRRSLGDLRTMKVITKLDSRMSGRDAFEPFTWRLARRSLRRTPAKLNLAKTQLQRVSHQLGSFMEGYDMFLTPVMGSAPVRLGEIDQNAPWSVLTEQLFSYVAFTPVANFTGFPAMSVPTYWTDGSLPIGTHFMGRFGDEFRLLSLAAQLEQAMPWKDRVAVG